MTLRLFTKSWFVAGIAGAALAAFLVRAGVPADPQLQKAIARGADAFAHEKFGGSGRVCESCHLGGGLPAGRRPDGVAIPSLANAAAVFPRISGDEGHSLITLSDQVRACVAGAIRGTPPAYGSDELNSLVAYVTSLSQGKAIEMGGSPR
ncbi:MAG: cytochrome C [Steroidobacteraceae bacterium]|jgi:thiosulfate dehydrogenase